MKSSIGAFLFVVFLGFISNSEAAFVYLYNGSGLPDENGWIRSSGAWAGSITIQPEYGGGANDMFRAATTGNAYNSYYYDTQYSTFIVSMRVAIQEGTHNSHDGGFTFSPIGSIYQTGLANCDRYFSLYIDPTQIGFQDLSASYSVDATSFHEYSIYYSPQKMSVYLDADNVSILSGTAIPILSRQIPSIHPNDGWENYVQGAIVFGDTSNDFFYFPEGINSKYTLDFLAFEGLELRQPTNVPIPEPSALLMSALSLLGAGGYVRRRFFSKH